MFQQDQVMSAGIMYLICVMNHLYLVCTIFGEIINYFQQDCPSNPGSIGSIEQGEGGKFHEVTIIFNPPLNIIIIETQSSFKEIIFITFNCLIIAFAI